MRSYLQSNFSIWGSGVSNNCYQTGETRQTDCSGQSGSKNPSDFPQICPSCSILVELILQTCKLRWFLVCLLNFQPDRTLSGHPKDPFQSSPSPSSPFTFQNILLHFQPHQLTQKWIFMFSTNFMYRMLILQVTNYLELFWHAFIKWTRQHKKSIWENCHIFYVLATRESEKLLD